MSSRLASRVRGVYAITPDELNTQVLLDKTAAILRGGVSILQYRNKAASPALQHSQAHALAALCYKLDVQLIVNDHLDLALGIPGAGLHIGANDGAVVQMRAGLGSDRLLGVSCYDSLSLAQQAVAAGADYVAFGSVFASPTKPAAVHAPLNLFAQARDLGVSLVGIGGIDQNNIAQLAQAGADAAALISDLYNSSELTTHAEYLLQLFVS